MREYFYSVIAKMLAFIGGAILFFVPFLFYWIAWSAVGYIHPLFGVLILAGCTILGCALIVSLRIIQRRLEEDDQFLADNGGPIHSGRVWKKGPESGLFQTWCGLVVSVNRDSGATAHVGYRIVPVKQATCKGCVQREGEGILDIVAHRRDSY